MKGLIWSARAQADLRSITRYHGPIAPDLPSLPIERGERAATTLLDHPHLGPRLADSDVRRWRVTRTPYLLFYRQVRDGLRILKVVHAPSDWKPAE